MTPSSTFHLIKAAAEAGDTYAQFELGVAFEEGSGTEPDSSESSGWYQKAARQGHTAALHNLILQQIYREGPSAEMIRLLQRKAEDGEVDCQLNYGLCLFLGSGVEKDFIAARKWYELAAKACHAAAQFNMGGLYFEGNGVDKDLDTAIHWYRLAAEQCHELALVQLGSLYQKGIGVQQNERQALTLYLLAYRRGSMRAAVHLGILYIKGVGVSRDAKRAYIYFEEAIGMVDSPNSPPEETYRSTAFYWLGKLTEELDPSAIEDALSWYRQGQTTESDACAIAVKRLQTLLPGVRRRPRHSRRSSE